MYSRLPKAHLHLPVSDPGRRSTPPVDRGSRAYAICTTVPDTPCGAYLPTSTFKGVTNGSHYTTKGPPLDTP